MTVRQARLNAGYTQAGYRVPERKRKMEDMDIRLGKKYKARWGSIAWLTIICGIATTVVYLPFGLVELIKVIMGVIA